MRVTKAIYTETSHRLMNHKGLCRNLHGHSYKWEVTISKMGELDEMTGMLIDFHDIKDLLKEFIDEPFDHATVLSNQDYALRDFLEDQGFKLLLLDTHPTAENFARKVACDISRRLGGAYMVDVKCWETTTSYAEASSYEGLPN